MVISHKGDAFSKIDIESISSAGDGTKTGDTNKTGFKGIGFKSVFSHSNFVIIKSGDFCFKFDKNAWKKHWNNAWVSKSTWQSERLAKQKDEELKMPWQIIPIWAELPTELKNLAVFQNFNVSTIIKYDKVESLQTELSKLFSDSQIVLFLRSKEVKITVNSNEEFTIEKIKQGESTKLKRNDTELSEWLIKTEVFDIPQNVQKEINADEKSPKKLKDANLTEISFAIQLEKGKLKAVDKANRLIFTYLPTSINYDFPFLVNASFLTDAGRQHLHQDIFWNNWIFKQIPLRFFAWVAELAHKDSKYNKQFLAIIPHKLGGSQLENSFNEGFTQAIDSIAFVPNQNGDLLKIKNTIFDKTNISNFISKQTVINYINSKTQKQFSISSFVPYIEPISTLSRLGTKIFDIEDLEGFFVSEIFGKEHKLDENFKLISFLYEQSEKSKNAEGKSVWSEKLKNTPFIFDENQKLRSPKHIYFPTVEFSDEFSDDLKIIHPNIVSKVNENQRIKSWLESLGVKEPSDINFIEKTIIAQVDSYITKENALKIGRYLFNAHKKGVLQDEHYEKLQSLKIFTKENSLVTAENSFLSNFYEPELRLENSYKNDFYVSESYLEGKDLKSEWKTFFIKIGVKEQLYWERFYISKKEVITRRDFNFFMPIISLMDGKSRYSNFGQYSYSISGFTLHHFTFIDHVTNHNFAKIYWSNVFKFAFNINSNDSIEGCSGFWGISHILKDTLNLPNYFHWSIENLELFPTKRGELKKAKDILINSPENIELAGNYLHVLDYDASIPENWLKILPFKKTLDLDDLLKVLELIYKQNTSEEVTNKENEKNINKIYEKISDNFLGYNKKLNNWGKTNKLLAKNGTNFFYPKDLSIVTVDGFNASNLAYANVSNLQILELLRFFGVSIIDKVVPTICNSTVEIKDLKHKLSQVSPLVALVAVEKSKNSKEWETEFSKINNKLKDIRFFQTSEIYLSYGNDEDKQKRSSWAEATNFYYVGNWYSPRILDGLIEPLGKFLNIRYAERILTVLLLENFAGGIEYLKEKGYDISLIPDELLNPKEPETIINQGNTSYNSDSESLGKLGEQFVYEELKRIYTKKYGQPIEETKTGFKIGSKLEVFWRNISENTTANHDFKVVELGKETYIDSKATPYAKNVEKVALYISGHELALMETAEKYLIARVYNVTTTPEMELIKLEISKLSIEN